MLTKALQLHKDQFEKLLPFDCLSSEIIPLDLSVNNPELMYIKFIDSAILGKYIQQKIKKAKAKIAIGGYLEDRMIYKRSEHFGIGEDARTIHLGIDIWCDEYTPIQAPTNGLVHSFNNNQNKGDYGPTIILEHQLNDITFYTLYGHLSKDSLSNIKVGQNIAAGETFAELGTNKENGDWPPHLHFQIITDMQNYQGDFPGVCCPSEKSKYATLCPNPIHLIKL
jgi:murein DD-endopeptidase MepM/ murein hydrolase activator NlpD